MTPEGRGQRFHLTARRAWEALDLSPEQQMKWALRYIAKRYGQSPASWSTWPSRMREKVEMGKRIEMGAPTNPYRRGEAMEVGVMGTEMFLGESSQWAAGSGPGLLGADIDRIARQHHTMGRREAEEEAAVREQKMRAQLADAYDEGYVAGRVNRAQGLAGDFRSRLLDLHFQLRQIESGPKSKAQARLAELRSTFDDVMAFADGIAASDGIATGALVEDPHTVTRIH